VAAVANGVVYFGSYDHTVYAVDAATGLLRWSATTGSSVITLPVVANGVLYAGSLNGKLFTFDATTGAPLSTITVGDDNDTPSSAVVVDGVVYTVAYANSRGEYLSAYSLPPPATTGGEANP
jgi:outer membrane protein assembly factor BamB